MNQKHSAAKIVAPTQEEMPFAVVQGKNLTALPKDLYIPPDALEVILEAFEGPLDLLLYLIRRQNLNILEIDVAEISRQYMGYIDLMKTIQLEVASDYMVMSAMLAEIKSRMLLPKRTEEDDEEDPRAELIRRLQDYERFKSAAEDLDELPRLGRENQMISVVSPMEKPEVGFVSVELNDLILAPLAQAPRARRQHIHLGGRIQRRYEIRRCHRRRRALHHSLESESARRCAACSENPSRDRHRRTRGSLT